MERVCCEDRVCSKNEGRVWRGCVERVCSEYGVCSEDDGMVWRGCVGG